MKKLFALLFILFSVSLAKAQEAPVTTNPVEIHTGILGIWLNKEYKMSNKLAIRAEVGLDGNLWTGTYSSGFVLIPVFTAEPRWYYNLEKRHTKLKTTKGNFGNFFSLRTSYSPDLFVISNYYTNIIPFLTIVPTWGIRRPLGKNFVFETGIGIGYLHNFYKSKGYISDDGELTANINLRFGYRF